VFTDNESAAIEPFPTPANAVMHAKELARRSRESARICVYDARGALLSQFDYEPPDAQEAAHRPRRRRPRATS
jgi:hypothetical protein